MSQNEQILKHLKERGSITSMDSFKYYQITRLSARIHDLRDLGYDIKTVTKHNKDNGKCYAEYTLAKD